MRRKQHLVRIFIFLAFIVCAFGAGLKPLRAAVYDGGEYSLGKISSHTDFGASDSEPSLGNFAFEQDRFTAAPVGKPLYVLGDDHNCYWGNFAYNKYEKALIVYYRTPVTTDHCIYQKQTDSKPAGYSISSKMGGVCVPTFGVGDSLKNWKLEETGSPVAFSLCVDQTLSYGENFKGTIVPAVTEKQGVPTVQAVAVQQNSVTTPTVDSNRQPTSTNPETTTVALGPSVQETKTPWNSGTSYREGFPSLNNEEKTWHQDTKDALAAVTTEEKPQLHADDAIGTKHESNPILENRVAGPASTISHLGSVTKSAEGGYTIQISSFTSRGEADEAVNKLKSHGLAEAWVMEANVGAKTVYRICSGHFTSRKEAKAAQPHVAEATGVKEAFIQKVAARTPASD